MFQNDSEQGSSFPEYIFGDEKIDFWSVIVNGSNIEIEISKKIGIHDKMMNVRHHMHTRQFDQIGFASYDVVLSILQLKHDKKYPQDEDILNIWLKLYLRLSLEYLVCFEDWENAFAVSVTMKSEFPYQHTSYTALAFCCWKSGNFKQGISTCNEGIIRFPSCEALFSLRGKSYYEVGQYKKAIQDFQKSIELARWRCGDPACVESSLKPWKRTSLF